MSRNKDARRYRALRHALMTRRAEELEKLLVGVREDPEFFSRFEGTALAEEWVDNQVDEMFPVAPAATSARAVVELFPDRVPHAPREHPTTYKDQCAEGLAELLTDLEAESDWTPTNCIAVLYDDESGRMDHRVLGRDISGATGVGIIEALKLRILGIFHGN